MAKQYQSRSQGEAGGVRKISTKVETLSRVHRESIHSHRAGRRESLVWLALLYRTNKQNPGMISRDSAALRLVTATAVSILSP